MGIHFGCLIEGVLRISHSIQYFLFVQTSLGYHCRYRSDAASSKGLHCSVHMGCNVRKCTFEHICPVKIQISLHIHTVRSEISLDHFEQPKMQSFFMWTIETDQTAWMRRLICLCWAYMSKGICVTLWLIWYG